MSAMGPSLLKTHSSADCNVSHKCALGCTTIASSNILTLNHNLNLASNPKLGVPKVGFMYP